MICQSRDDSAEKMLSIHTLLNRITNRIRQSLELQEILSATVAEMRSFLATDRVKIYKFHPDGAGQVIAESIDRNRLPSLLGLHFPATDIPPQAREMFVKDRMRSIVDLPNQQITLNLLNYSEETAALTWEEMSDRSLGENISRPVDPCHVKYLTAMGIQSSLVIPIIHNEQLWGLLASHHAEPKTFSEQELQIVQMVATQVSIAISQSNLLSETREKARQEALINQISTLLHAPLRIQEILQIVLKRIVKAVNASGGRIYLSSNDSYGETQLYTTGTQPDLLIDNQTNMLENYSFWQQLMADESNQSFKEDDLINPESFLDIYFDSKLQAIADIYLEPELESVAPFFHPTRIRSLLVMPLKYNGNSLGCLTLFRDEIDTEIVWAGRFEPDERNVIVRDSFAAWRQQKLGQSQEWIDSELNLIKSLGTHLNIAIMQHRLYQHERQQRFLVEMRNQELNIARAAAEEANRLKSDFLSSTSHELRTPLASTLNYLKLLKEGFYDNKEELKEFVNIAYQSADNLVSIINDVLDIAKIEAGKMSVNLELFKLQPLLEEQRRLFNLESTRKGIEFIIESNVDTLYADKLKLRQILTNLLSNAFKFTQQGKVCLKAMSHPTQPIVEISVSDTGIGIDINKRYLLFEAFVQADGSIKRRYGGTGLGLTVCKRLVKLMGGNIWLESPGIGQGTTAIFTIPTTTKAISLGGELISRQ